MSGLKPAVFLDRDGTLIRDRPGYYLKRAEEVRVYRRVPEALGLLRRAGYRLVVVTNQSGLARGFFDRAGLARIHARLARDLRRGGARLDAIYFCPHHPDDACRCRKPLPFLARRAARDMGLDLAASVVVGDKRADLGLARALGIPGVLVLSGHGRHELSKAKPFKPAAVRRDLLGAARWILKRGTRP